MTSRLMAALGRKPAFAESLLALHMAKAGYPLDEIVRAING